MRYPQQYTSRSSGRVPRCSITSHRLLSCRKLAAPTSDASPCLLARHRAACSQGDRRTIRRVYTACHHIAVAHARERHPLPAPLQLPPPPEPAHGSPPHATARCPTHVSAADNVTHARRKPIDIPSCRRFARASTGDARTHPQADQVRRHSGQPATAHGTDLPSPAPSLSTLSTG